MKVVGVLVVVLMLSMVIVPTVNAVNIMKSKKEQQKQQANKIDAATTILQPSSNIEKSANCDNTQATHTTATAATTVDVKLTETTSSSDSTTSSNTESEVPYSSVDQLTVSTDLASLTTEIARGLVTKSTSVMIAWQAAQDSTQIVKEIHSLAGGEAGVTSGRTWVYNVTGFGGLDDWMTTYATELADHGTYSSTAGTLSWVVKSSPIEEPSNATCQAFAVAIGDGDLASALVIASFTYTQNLLLSTNVLAAQVALQTGGSLLAERYDSSCLGYKYFNYYDSPTEWSSSTVSPAFTD